MHWAASACRKADPSEMAYTSARSRDPSQPRLKPMNPSHSGPRTTRFYSQYTAFEPLSRKLFLLCQKSPTLSMTCVGGLPDLSPWMSCVGRAGPRLQFQSLKFSFVCPDDQPAFRPVKEANPASQLSETLGRFNSDPSDRHDDNQLAPSCA